MKLVALVCGLAMLFAFLELVNVTSLPVAQASYEQTVQLRTRRVLTCLGLWFAGVIGLMSLAIRACL